MKMAEKVMRGVAPVFAVLAIGLLLVGSASAATIEEEIVVNQKDLFITEFMVKEIGLTYTELDLDGANEEIGFILISPSGEVKKEVWGKMPLALRYEVSKDEVEEGTEWKILVQSGLYDDAYGTLKVTYPSDTTPPTITITCSPENPTTDQQITFIATASDKCKIEIWVNAKKVKECLGSGSCTYIGGPYLDYAGTSVAYGANAYDEAGNRAWTGYKVVQISEAGDGDTTPPTVIEKSPTGENVPVSTQIAIAFSEPMNEKSTEYALYIYGSEQSRVSGKFSWEGDTMVFTPSSNLAHDTRYFAYLYSDAMDLAYNSLDWYEWNFKTGLPNNPPDISNRPTGPSAGYAGVSYSYSIFTKDPDGDQIQYIFDWDDGTTSETELVDSGRSASQSHVWDDEGEYSVRVMAADSEGGESGWSPPLVVAISERTHPTAYIRIYPNPADEGESVTLEGWGEDEDGEVVEFRWTLPDRTNISDHGDSSELTLEPGEVVAGVYRFAVRDDDGIWSEEVGEELEVEVETEFPTEPIIPVVLAAIAVLAAGALLVYRVLRKPPIPEPDPDPEKDEDKHGSIHATSDPSDAVLFVDGAYKGRSPKTIDNVLIGPHTVMFLKRGYFGYERGKVVIPNQTIPVHCDLTKMPEVKLKLSADPAEIVSDRESRSMITIEILTKDDNEIPIPVPNDTTVILETDIGAIESPVKIPRGRASVTSTLISTSPASRGTATVKAEAEYGKIVKLKGSTTVEFLDAESK